MSRHSYPNLLARHSVHADELTGLPNRIGFLAYLDNVLAHAQPFAVLLLDCDHFKTINDSLGHPAGDQVLLAINTRLQASLTSTDVIARIDGDEFALLLTNVADLDQALATAEHILRALDEPFLVMAQEVFLSVSIGIVTSRPAYLSAADVLRDADTALHHAKELGRGRYSVFSAHMHARAVQRMKMETEIRQALKQEEFRVFYQPIVALDTGVVTGFEALIRWQHPERQLLAPGEFLPFAEDLGLSVAIDRWVLRTAGLQMSRWIAQFPAVAGLTLSVNMSGYNLEQPDLLPFIRSVLHDTGLSPRNLVLEMTEEVLLKHRDTTITALHHLRNMGIQVSLDDFGTGYSSLSYLHNLPVSTLKIDRSFISSMDVNPQASVITNAIIDLAHALKMTVVAEGIETVQHLNSLRNLSCELAQGYYFSRPLDVAKATELLDQAQYQIAAAGPASVPGRAADHARTYQSLPLQRVVTPTSHSAPPTPAAPAASSVPVPQREVQSPADPATVVERDPLTGLLTRAALQSQFEQALEQHRFTNAPFALAVIDLDHFKSINDAFGHSRGDEVLKEFAARVRSATRSQDSIFRYGGDEFVLLLRNTSAEQARIFADRLLDLVRGQQFRGDPPLALTISAGIAICPLDSDNLAGLFEIADQRSFQAKRGGRGRAVLHDMPVTAEATLDGPARIIERDDQIQTLHAFLSTVTQRARGVLQLGGESGNGLTRFLAEAATAARLRGYGVIEFAGSPALKERLYGVLSVLTDEWRDLPLPSQGVHRFAAGLAAAVRQRNLAGIVITLDDASLVDQASLEFLQDLFAAPEQINLALLYAPAGLDTTLNWPQDSILHSRIDLEPLSHNGVRTWIRHSLNWEMPDHLLYWFYGQTGGRPLLIRRGLQHILRHEMLHPAPGGWQAWPDLTTIQIREQLAWQTVNSVQNLPMGQTDFVGREADIARIKHLLSQQRAVSIVGLGGTGKSRLAIQVAAESAAAFADGVCYVQLAQLSSAEFLFYTIADALGVSLVGAQSPREQILFHLSSKRLLLLLDNFEHLREETFFLHEIIERAAGVQLIITSRDRLVFSGAVTFELAGLPIPQGERAVDIAHSSAVQLFVRRAHHVDVEFRLNDENAASVSRICQLVEGLPLGIELAAAWTRTFSCAAIADKIESSLTFLQQDTSGVGERHRSLMAMIDSFWLLLSDHERSLLRQIAIFRGGFDGSAAREVIDASPFFLEGLVAKGYLRWTREKRYEIHELLRQYAAEKLRSRPDEGKQAGMRHSSYYLAMLEQQDLWQFGSRHMLAQIDVNRENIRCAWQWAVEHGRFAELERSIEGLEAFYDYKGAFHEAEALFRASAVQLETQCAAADPAAQMLHSLICRVQAARARFLIRCSRFTEAIETAQFVARQATLLHDAKLEALGAYHEGTALLNQGLYEMARQRLEHAAGSARNQQFFHLHADSLRRLSRVAGQMGNDTEARVLGEQSLALCRIIGDRQREARMLNDLGIVADSQGDYVASKSYYERCLQLCRELGDEPGAANALLNLGAVAGDQGEYTQAERHLEQALRLFRESGNLLDESIVLENLGDCARWQGELDRAAACYEQALRICRKIGDRQGQSYLLSNLGLVACQRGDHMTAQSFSEQALEIAREIGDNRGQGLALCYLGHALSGLHNLTAACEMYHAASSILHASGQQHLCADAWAGLARLALEQADCNAALQHIEPVLARLEYGALDGNAEPLRIYLTCYQVLHACADPRAYVILRNAYDLLQQRAARITNPERRNGFLVRIPSHQEVLIAAKAYDFESEVVLT